MVDLRKNDDSGAAYKPLDDGWNERIKGTRQSDNPFAINNWKHYEWKDGWHDADKAIKKESKN